MDLDSRPSDAESRPSQIAKNIVAVLAEINNPAYLTRVTRVNDTNSEANPLLLSGQQVSRGPRLHKALSMDVSSPKIMLGRSTDPE